MVSATGDWTTNTIEREYPAVRALYALLGASRSRARRAVRRAAQLQPRQPRGRVRVDGALAAERARRRERPETPLHAGSARRPAGVSPARRCPPNAVTPAQLTANWIARRAGGSLPPANRGALAGGAASRARLRRASPPRRQPGGRAPAARSLVAGRRGVERRCARPASQVRRVDVHAVRRGAAAKVRHFDTYNRTAASQRVADIVARAAPVAGRDARRRRRRRAAGAARRARRPACAIILDVGGFDTSSDARSSSGCTSPACAAPAT